MPSLKQCLIQAGKTISRDDADAIMADAAKYESAGYESEEAAYHAIDQTITSVEKEVDAVIATMQSAGVDVKYERDESPAFALRATARPAQATTRRRAPDEAGHTRELGSGRYIGAPDWIGSDENQIPVLHALIRQLALEGERGRYWYEQSSRAILKMVGGNIDEAEKIVGLIAIYSPNSQVPGNTTAAIRAYYQWKAGMPIQAGLGTGNQKATDLLERGEGWKGVKTNSFYQNLMVEIDASRLDPNVATMDMWMAIALDYGKKQLDQGPTYNFAEREIQYIAKQLGWKAHQVQAAVWTAMKGRVDPIRNEIQQVEIGLGIGEMVWKTDKETGKRTLTYEVKKDKKKEHFRLVHKMGMQREITQEGVTAAKYDFSDAFEARLVQLSWEATPSKESGVLPQLLTAPLEVQLDYLARVQAILAPNGKDLIAEMVGLMPGYLHTGFSAWEGETGAGAQSFFPAPIYDRETSEEEQKAGMPKKVRDIRPEVRTMLDLYSAIRGYLLSQQAVAYHHPVYKVAAKWKNGYSIDVGRILTQEEGTRLYKMLIAKFGRDDIAPAAHPTGARILNFTEFTDNPVSNAAFQKAMLEVGREFSGTIVGHGEVVGTPFSSVGNYITTGGADGKVHLEGRLTGQPDLQRRVDDLKADVEALNRDFANEHGWDEAPAFSVRRAGRAGRAGRGAADEGAARAAPWSGRTPHPLAVTVQATHFSKAAGLRQLLGRMFGTQHKGAESKRLLGLSKKFDAIQQRVYFYPNDSGLSRHGESVTGRKAKYTQTFNNIYDSAADPLDLKSKLRAIKDADWANEFELAVVKAGFDGYRTDTMVVVLGLDVPVQELAEKPEAPAFSLAEAAEENAPESRVVTTVKAVQGWISLLKWGGVKDVNIVQNVEDLPAEILAKFDSESASLGIPGYHRQNAEAFYHAGELWVIASRMRGLEHTYRAIMEEGMHRGLRRFFGAKFNAFLDDAWALVPDDERKELSGRYYPGKEHLVAFDPKMRRKITDEYLAQTDPDGLRPNPSMIDRFMGWLRGWGKETGFDKAALTREDVHRILHQVHINIRSAAAVPEDVANDLVTPRGPLTGEQGEPAEEISFALARQTGQPNFKRWFKKSEVVGEFGEPLVVYHATRAKENFSVFRFSKDFGYHFGTADAASKALTTRIGGGNRQKGGARLIPAYLSIQNPLVLSETVDLGAIGGWEAFEVMKQFVKLGILTDPMERVYDIDDATGKVTGKTPPRVGKIEMDIWEYALDVRKRAADSVGGEAKRAKLSVIDRNAAALKVMVRDLQQIGYDGIKYENRIEGGTSWIAFKSRQIKSAIGNDGTFGELNEDINFSLAGKPRTPKPIFHSALVRAVQNTKDSPWKANAKAWKQWLTGAQSRGQFKQIERFWMGVDNWLDANGTVTRDQLLQFVKAYDIPVTEKVRGAKAIPKQQTDRYERIEEIHNSLLDLGLDVDVDDDGTYFFISHNDPMEVIDRDDAPQEANDLLVELYAVNELVRGFESRQPHSVSYADYQLEGEKTDYFELELQLPTSAYFAAKLTTFHQKLLGKYKKVWTKKEYRERVLEEDVFLQHIDAADRFAFNALYQQQQDAFSHDAPHFHGDRNILVHIRFNTRIDADGKRVLFIEEIQSDWSQQGRKQGFGSAQSPAVREAKARLDEISARIAELERIREAKYDAIAHGLGYESKYRFDDEANTSELRAFDEAVAEDTDLLDLEEQYELAGIQHNVAEGLYTHLSGGDRPIPAAPFVSRPAFALIKDNEEVKNDKGQVQRYESLEAAQAAMASKIAEVRAKAKKAKVLLDMADVEGWRVADLGMIEDTETWVELAVKRAIRWAADNKFDRVAWTTGDQQADRYSLAKKVANITYEKTEKGYYVNVIGIDGPNILNRDMDEDEIEEHFGKEILERMQNKVGIHEGDTEPDLIGTYTLKGDDLILKHKGMRDFYDRIVAKVVNKILKKFGGGTVGRTAITVEEPSWPEIKYTGPDMSWGEVEKRITEMRASQPRAMILALRAVALDMDENSMPFAAAMELHGTEALAEFLGGKLSGGEMITPPPSEQQAFDINPELKEAAEESFPKFSIRRKKGSAAQEAAANASMGPAAEDITLGDKIRQLLRDIVNAVTQWDSIIQGIFDAGYSIKRMEREINKGVIGDASESAHKMYGLTKNLASVMAAVSRYGVPKFVNGSFVIDDSSKGFIEIFRPLFTSDPEGSLLRLWESYAAAKRASRLINELNPDGTSREKNFTPERIAELLALEHEYPIFVQVLEDWNKFNGQLLDLAVERGVLSAEERKAWATNDYVPFYRAQEEIEWGVDQKSGGMQSFRGISGQRHGIKRLSGGEGKIEGAVVENMFMNTTYLIDKIYKNTAMQRTAVLMEGKGMNIEPMGFRPVKLSVAQLARALMSAGFIVGDDQTDEARSLNTALFHEGVPTWAIRAVEKLTPKQKEEWTKVFTRVAPMGHNIVSVMMEGKPVYYRVEDPLLLRTLLAMGPDTHGAMMEFASLTKSVLTTAITMDPGFMVANVVRDTISAWVTSNVNFTPVIDTWKGAAQTVMNDKKLFSAMMAGAGMGGFYSHTGEDTRKVLSDQMPTRLAGVAKWGHSFWRGWRKLGAISENANRLAIQQKALADGASPAEAAYQAMDIMNFTQQGDYKLIRGAVRVLPFFNARLQGLYRLGRGYKENKQGFLMKGAALFLFTAALAWKNWDDDRYWELEDHDRDSNWHFWIGEHHFRFPKPFEVGAIFGTIPERSLALMREDERLKDFGHSMVRVAFDTFAMNPFPQLIRPLVEQYANKNMFTGRRIVPLALEGVEPEQQYTPWTSQTARLIAEAMPNFKWLGMARSPARVEALIRGYFGTLGMWGLGAADRFIARPAMGETAPGHEVLGISVPKAQDWPVISRFYEGTQPTRTRYENEAYDLLDLASKAQQSVNKKMTEGDADTGEFATERAELLSMRKPFTKLQTILKNFSSAQRQVMMDDTLGPEEKMAQIDQLTKDRNDTMRGWADYIKQAKATQ